jgi:hypothetical protein
MMASSQGGNLMLVGRTNRREFIALLGAAPLTIRSNRSNTAYHEASHAVVAHVLDFAVRYVSIVPDDTSQGRMSWNKPTFLKDLRGSDPTPHQRRNIENRIVVLLAGPSGMRRHNPRSHWRKSGTGYGPFMYKGADFDIAGKLIDILHDDARVKKAYWDYVWARAEVLVENEWDWIDSVARHLLEHKTFDGDLRDLNPQSFPIPKTTWS